RSVSISDNKKAALASGFNENTLTNLLATAKQESCGTENPESNRCRLGYCCLMYVVHAGEPGERSGGPWRISARVSRCVWENAAKPIPVARSSSGDIIRPRRGLPCHHCEPSISAASSRVRCRCHAADKESWRDKVGA